MSNIIYPRLGSLHNQACARVPYLSSFGVGCRRGNGRLPARYSLTTRVSHDNRQTPIRLHLCLVALRSTCSHSIGPEVETC